MIVRFRFTPLLLIIVAVVGHSTAIAQLSVPLPQAHWSFDEGLNDYTQVTTEDSVGSVDATWEEATGAGLGWAVGQLGGAALLDGADAVGHNFLIPSLSVLDGVADFTISGWFNPSELGQGGDSFKGLFSSRDVTFNVGPGVPDQNVGVSYQSNIGVLDARFGFSGSSNQLDSTTVPTQGEWTHFALVYDSGPGLTTATFYVNGAQDPATTELTPFDLPLLTGGEWSFGDDPNPDNDTRHFRGLLDDYAVFTSALSSSAIGNLYQNGLDGFNAKSEFVGTCGAGDVDCGGSVNAADLTAIQNNFSDTVTARSSGDLTGDGVVNLLDYAEWYANAPAPLLAELGLSGSPVPEPSGVALVVLAGLSFVGLRGRKLGRGGRFVAIVCVVAALFADAQATYAQDPEVVLTVQYADGAATLSNPSTTAVDVNSYVIFFEDDVTGISESGWSSLTDQGEPGWLETGNPAERDNRITEFTTGASFSISSANSPRSLGTPINLDAAQISAGFGVNVESLLRFEYASSAIVAGTVEFEGNQRFNNLVLDVDEDGNATITNESAVSVELIGYSISGGAGNLNGSTFTGLRGSNPANNWLDANSDGDEISEIIGTGGQSLTLAKNSSFALGDILTGKVDALEFDFVLKGELSDRDGAERVLALTTPGDFDGDDDVDGADFLDWQRRLGTDLEAGDLAAWQTNYGTNNNLSASIASVPEPSAVVLYLIAFTVYASRRNAKLD